MMVSCYACGRRGLKGASELYRVIVVLGGLCFIRGGLVIIL